MNIQIVSILVSFDAQKHKHKGLEGDSEEVGGAKTQNWSVEE